MKRIKLYVPGLLSLLLLFPLLHFKLADWGIFDTEYVLEVNWYSPENGPSTEKFPPSKNFIDINLTGSTVTDKLKLEYAKVIVNELVAMADTTRGVHVTFADTAKYESFIEILDFCNQQEGLAYAPHENSFWIFNRIKKKEEQIRNVWLWNCIVLVPLGNTQDNSNFAWVINYGTEKRFWPIGLLFVLLVLASFKRTLAR